MNLPSIKEARYRSKDKTKVYYDKYIIPESIEKIGKDKKYTILTYGCQMNVHDSENISGIMEELMYTKEEEAIKDYEETMRIDPRNPHAYNNMGVIFKDNREFVKAIEYFKKAIEVMEDEVYVQFYNNIGKSYKPTVSQYEACSSSVFIDLSFTRK